MSNRIKPLATSHKRITERLSLRFRMLYGKQRHRIDESARTSSFILTVAFISFLLFSEILSDSPTNGEQAA
jgi:hypothetical protein